MTIWKITESADSRWGVRVGHCVRVKEGSTPADKSVGDFSGEGRPSCELGDGKVLEVRPAVQSGEGGRLEPQGHRVHLHGQSVNQKLHLVNCNLFVLDDSRTAWPRLYATIWNRRGILKHCRGIVGENGSSANDLNVVFAHLSK